jgi:PsbP-like protein
MIKKVAMLLICAVLIVSVSAAGCTSNVGKPTPSAPTNMYDSAKGFTIIYPSDWTKDVPKSGPISVLFRMPTNNSSENVNVQVWNRSANETLSNRTASILAAVQEFSNYTEISAGNATLGGNEAYMVSYTATYDGDYLKFIEIWTIKQGKEYLITYKADPQNFDTYASTAQQMIDSFKIK